MIIELAELFLVLRPLVINNHQQLLSPNYTARSILYGTVLPFPGTLVRFAGLLDRNAKEGSVKFQFSTSWFGNIC